MKKLFIPILIILGIGINVFAQEKSNREIKGDKYFFNYSFDKAITTYNRVNDLTQEGQRKLAESHYNIHQNVQAEAEYSKLISKNKSILPEDYFNYAMVLRKNSKHTEAAKWMEKFKELKPNDLRVKDYLANNSDLANLLKDNGKYKINHLDVNTDALDFGTSFYKDQLVFVSSTSRNSVIVRNYNWTNKPFWDIYVADIEGDQLKNSDVFDKRMNGKLHDGPVSFSRNGNYLAFTKNNYEKKAKNSVVELQIWFSTYINDDWSEPEPFYLNNVSYSVGHPCLTADGNTMYFASDMPGGFGGVDLYRVKRGATGAWGPAENLGDGINTEGDEMFPFLEEDSGRFYFSSNGRFGLGGLDIFETATSGSGFGPVTNVGYPLNTKSDDFAFVVKKGLTKGYFSSNRDGGRGGDDIYAVTIRVDADLPVNFWVHSPENIISQRKVRETFPLRNYIFFDQGSTEIPDRYVLLNEDQVIDFGEDQLEQFIPVDVPGRSKRQLVVYYNVLNILGDRMLKNPLSTIKLSGASELGPEDGSEMSQSVKDYLTGIFGIDASRITTEGRYKPKLPSEQPDGVLELVLLGEDDRRVSVESSSPALLMEFQSGPDALLKPLEISTLLEAPIDSYVTFNVDGAQTALSSWSMEIEDDEGVVQNFGPYYQDAVSIPGKSILGDRTSGEFKVTMIGQTKQNNIVKMDTTVQMKLWSAALASEGLRFSIIYEFDDSNAISIYEKYLTDVVLPKIPNDAKVIIHGYTDIIGETAYNLKLSLQRANDVKLILENGLSKLGRKDVSFEVYGFGEDENLSQFNNKYPEERFYNRTVIIDVVPKD